jgi:hypothetical protein
MYTIPDIEAKPRHWTQINWPYGLLDTIIKTDSYLNAVIDWFMETHEKWFVDLDSLCDLQVNQNFKVHWGEEAPLYWIVTIIAQHHVYHAGEINQLLSIYRGETWEEGEVVEENSVSTIGHRVRPPWKDEQE